MGGFVGKPRGSPSLADQPGSLRTRRHLRTNRASQRDPVQPTPWRREHEEPGRAPGAWQEGGERKRQEPELLTEAKFNGKSSSLLYYTLVSQTKKILQVKKVLMVTQHFIHIS